MAVREFTLGLNMLRVLQRGKLALFSSPGLSRQRRSLGMATLGTGRW